MGKRSNFERKERDFYPTPSEAVAPLVPHLEGCDTYAEPMAGNGALLNALDFFTDLECTWKSDIFPAREDIQEKDALKLTLMDLGIHTDVIITNPPWSRDILHETILRLSAIRPTWLLFDADWMHTLQSIPYMRYCKKIQSVGRVKWFPETSQTGKDNVCWYLFDQNEENQKASFFSRGWMRGDMVLN